MSRSTDPDLSPPPAAPAVPAPAAGPPPPPRAVTQAALNRSWGEPQVRVWWLCALLLLVTIICFSISQWWNWLAETRLIRSGKVVDAVIIGQELDSLKGSHVDPSVTVYLTYQYNGVEQTIRGILPPRDSWYVTRKTIPIHIDPENPQNWTASTAIKSLSSELLLAKLLLPLTAVLFVGAVLRRRSVLKLWQTGEAAEAVVLESHQAANAPLSRLVRCALKLYGRSDEVFTVILPTRVARPVKGNEIWLIIPAAGTRALAARLYE